MTTNETAKSPGGSPANVHFQASRPDPAAASFTLGKPLAAGFTFRKRKWNMLHFHSHQSADAVPGKLHNDVDITNWLCKKKKKSTFQGENVCEKPQQMISAYTCVCGVIPFLFRQERIEVRKHFPCQRDSVHLRMAAGGHISLQHHLTGAMAGGSAPTLRDSMSVCAHPAELSIILWRRKSWEQKNLKWKRAGTLELHNDASKLRNK